MKSLKEQYEEEVKKGQDHLDEMRADVIAIFLLLFIAICLLISLF